MKEKALTVEFRLPPTGTAPAPKPLPGEKAERQRQERAARKARNLALAMHIDSLIRLDEIKDLAEASRRCAVSRTCVSKLLELRHLPAAEQEELLLESGSPCCLRCGSGPDSE